MSSAQSVSPVLDKRSGRRRGHRRRSMVLILSGLALVLLAALMLWVAQTYRPYQVVFTSDQAIQRSQIVVAPATSKLRRPSLPEVPSTGQRQTHTVPVPALAASRPLQRATSRLDTFANSAHDAADVERFSLRRADYRVSVYALGTPHPVPASFFTPRVSPQALSSSDETTPSETDSLSAESQKEDSKPGLLRRFFRWFTGLFKRKKAASNHPPVISSIHLSQTTLNLTSTCPKGSAPDAQHCPLTGNQVKVNVSASDADGDLLRFKATPEAGTVSGDGPDLTWDMTGARPGVYLLKVSGSDGKAVSESASVRLSVVACDCVPRPCPSLLLTGPDIVREGSRFDLRTEVEGLPRDTEVTYQWTISAGRIAEGQGTNSITIDTNEISRFGEPNQSITAIVAINADSYCSTIGQFTIRIDRAASISPGLSISGTVVDSQGNPVQHATVTLIAKDGIARTMVTDNEGRYRFEDLARGEYRVEVTVAGFKKAVWEGDLRSGMSPDLHFSLETSGVGEVVNVSADAPRTRAGRPPRAGDQPPHDKVVKQDQIKVSYPERILKDRESEVSFELEQVLREVVPSQITDAGLNVVIDKPGPIPGAKPDSTLSDAFEGYEAYAVVRLIPNGLVVTSQHSEVPQLLDGSPVKWVWRVKPTDEATTECSFKFQVDVVWKPKPGKVLPDKQQLDVWPHDPFKVPTVPPLLVKLAGDGFPLPLGGGALALGVGVYPGVRRRREDEVADEAVAEEIEDEVSSTVYAPTEALPGDVFLVQVFAHLAEQAAAVEEMAKEADTDARKRISSQLKQNVKRGTDLSFHLSLPGLDVDEPVQSGRWEGEPIFAQFMVTVPPDHKPVSLIGTVVVSQSSVPLGHLKFKFKIVSSGDESVPADSQPVALGNLVRYKQAFISYASKDRPEVLKRVQMLNLVKLKFFQDLLTLEPGDNWEKQIYKYIDESDVIFLFWSKAASESVWVKKEVIYALHRRGMNEAAPPEIVPVIIEGPPPAKPPEELSFLHFNDKFIYFINSP